MLDYNKLPTVAEDGEQMIVVTELSNGRIEIPLSAFQARFEGAQSYDDFASHPNATDGWKAIFEQWQQAGYFDEDP